jgi:hypothetical protein
MSSRRTATSDSGTTRFNGGTPMVTPARPRGAHFALLLDIAAILAMLLALAPFFVLSRYAHPSYDDWCDAARTREMGLLAAVKWIYLNFSGRFVAVTISHLDPISGTSMAAYRVFSAVVLGALLLGVFWLTYEVLRRRVGRARIAESALAAFLIYLCVMPSTGEAFYWYTGAAVTTCGMIFGLFAFAAMTRSHRAESSVSAWIFALMAGLLAALAAGTNEIVLLPFGFTLLVLWFLSRRYARARSHLLLVPLFLAAAVGVVDVLAPGNYKRAAMTGGLRSVAGPLAGSVASLASALVDWMSRGPIIIATTALIVAGVLASARVTSDSAWRRTSWVIPLAVGALNVWGILFFTHWASGIAFRPPPDRVLNVALLFFMLTTAPAAFMAGVQLLGRYGDAVSQVAAARPWMMLLLAMTLFGNGNVRTAYLDLV